MSISVNLATNKSVEEKVLFENLNGIYAPIYCTGNDADNPTTRFGTFMRSNRGVEVTKKSSGMKYGST